MNPLELQTLLELAAGHVRSLTVCAARLVPVVFLCPFLGGRVAPGSVRLAVVLSLSLGLHFGAGVGDQARLWGAWELAAAVGREVAFGVAVGLVSALPFEAARIGGRFVDLFRGTSAEAILPGSGNRESATGEGLHQLLIALALASGAAPAIVAATWRSFHWVPVGSPAAGEGIAETVVRVACTTFATGLAIGAPVAALALAVDAVLGLVARAAPQMQLLEVGAPVRILGGGAVLWLAIGVVSHRLLAGVQEGAVWIRGLAEAAR